jgi:hypothetical protein
MSDVSTDTMYEHCPPWFLDDKWEAPAPSAEETAAKEAAEAKILAEKEAELERLMAKRQKRDQNKFVKTNLERVKEGKEPLAPSTSVYIKKAIVSSWQPGSEGYPAVAIEGCSAVGVSFPTPSNNEDSNPIDDNSIKKISVKKGESISWSNVSVLDYDYLNQFRWNCTQDGYMYRTARRGDPNQETRMHRVVALRMGLDIKDKWIDHRDRDRSNNSRPNLRIASASLNNHNRGKQLDTTSTFIGVSWNENGWHATLGRITKNFKTEESAAFGYDLMAYEKYGEDANINGVPQPEDFEDQLKRGPKRRPLEHRNIKQMNGKYFAFVIKNKVRTGRSFSTIEEAHAWRDMRRLQINEELEATRNAQPVTRTTGDIAFVWTGGKERHQILVDDDHWRFLQIHSCTNTINGYVDIFANGVTWLLHRWIMTQEHGPIPIGMVVDHINGNTRDNRRSNLRIVSRSVNGQNKSVTDENMRGLSREGSVWRASIRCQGVQYRLGSFSTQLEAAEAYNRKAKELFGEQARLNLCQ